MPDPRSTRFAASSKDEREAVESRCERLLDELASHHAGLREAMGYALLGGGKRLRALLCLRTHDFAGGRERDAALDAAAALECVHAYSLVHDDLPCMDDDDLRRGRPSCHVRFGEATAVLAGDALLTLAFGILSTTASRHPGVTADTVLSAVSVLASAGGTSGLVGGQALDLAAEGEVAAKSGIDDVDRIHTAKTGRLIAAAMELGALFGGADEALRHKVREAGLAAGRAFQIVDDLLDLDSDQETLGKTPGKDVKKRKLTYPAIVGPEASREAAAALVARAKAALGGIRAAGDPAPLSELIDFIAERAA